MLERNGLPGAGFTEKFCRIDAQEIRYAQAGSGPDLVVLPPSPGLTFNPGADLLSRQFRVTMIEPPGWGQSPPEQKAVPFPNLAPVTSALLTEIGIEGCILAGSSIGATHALWVAGLDPDRVTALILDAPMAFRGDQWAMPGLDPGMIVRAAEQGADLSALMPAENPKKPWADLAYRQQQMRNILRVIEFTGPEFDEDLASLLRPLAIPTLLLYGAKDPILYPAAAGNFAGILRDYRAIILDEAEHDIPGECPERYVELVLGFLGGLSKKPD